MPTSSRFNATARRSASERDGPSAQSTQATDNQRSQVGQLSRWGGVAGLAGVVSLLGSVAVVVSLGLPDASDVETLTDFADIESGRIAEHFLYLGAVVLFALHVSVLYQLLKRFHPAAALFGMVAATFGLLIMAASSVLHVSTSPLADLYNDPGTSPEAQQAIEYAWYGAQSVFDTMLTTGVLLVPIGIVLFGIAMRSAPAFGPRLTAFTIGLGTVGVIGATIAIVDPGSMFSAASVLAIAVFHLGTGWRTLKLGNEASIDLTDNEPTAVD